MLWFTGSIPEAIIASKQRKLPFVVYIEGSDEVSIEMGDVWSELQVSELLSQDKCIAIKLANESEQCAQFSQLYPVVCIPSLFIIGENGMPLEVLGGRLTSREIISKATAAFEVYHSQSSSGPVQVKSEDGSSEGSSQSAEHARSQVKSEPTAEQSSQPSRADPSLTNESVSIEERVEKARRLIEQKRKEKAEREKQEQIEKEAKRREEGQQLVNAKRQIEERKQQELVNQIREDRAKERAAREAVRQQIARDKAEREAQKQAELKERQQAQDTSASTTAASTYTGGGSYSNVRLQFRLPDGSGITHLFPADALLSTAHQYVVSHTGSRLPSVAMSTTYPRRQFTDDDMQRSLTDLGLAPSATIIVSSAKASSSEVDSAGLFGWLLAPFIAIFTFISAFLFGSPAMQRGSYGASSSREREDIPPEQSKPDRTEVRRRATSPRGSNQSSDGNIHRLQNFRDDEDDQNTWNGNSTQQM
ncbi:UBX domain-containing protein 4 [Nematostella vectensis]|uniref:UBX domain-containing protein 4 n=1 Tax=Nematostella vectensis TaxID=45351 RepID=UPI00138FFA98|nr:UBX domain-containing protein 4 [Nematostella vectensis]